MEQGEFEEARMTEEDEKLCGKNEGDEKFSLADPKMCARVLCKLVVLFSFLP